MADETQVLDPSGQIGSIPQEQLQDALAQGYKVAQPSDVQSAEQESQYGTPTEMLKTFGEGAANAATFGGFRHLQRALDISPRGIIGREETNPITYGAGEMAGLVGTSALGIGEGALLERAGQAAVEATGLAKGTNLVSKVGSQAVKGAVENSLFQGGDEVAKAAVSDPNQTFGTAIADIGISGLLGGGIGAGLGVVSPLWEATSGGRLKSYLDLFKERANGGQVPYETSVKNAIEDVTKSGIEIAPELQASMSSDPELRKLHANLIDSGTKPGINMKEAVDNFHDSLTDHILEQSGKSKEYLKSIYNKSDNQLATDISKSITDDLKSRIEPIGDAYESFEKKAGNIPLMQEQDVIADQISKWASDNRLIGRGNAGEDLYNYAMKRLPVTKDLVDLKNLQQDIWGQVYKHGIPDQQGVHYAGELVGMLREMEQQTIARGLGEKLGAQAVDQFTLARVQYSDMMKNVIDPLSSKVGINRYKGAKGFLNALDEKFGDNPEKILKKLNPKDDANMIALIEGEFPQVGSKLKEYHQDEALWKAMKNQPEGKLNTKQFLNSMKELSPEMRNWMYTDKQQKMFNAFDVMSQQLKSIDHNFSGTAKAADMMKEHALGGAMAAVAALTGHSAIGGAVLGEVGRYLTRDLPDAIKLGLLKYLGSPLETNPKGFASMVNYLSAVYKGEAKTNKVIKSLFDSNVKAVPARIMDIKEYEKIDKRLNKLKEDPSDLSNVGNDVVHYMPDHGAILSHGAANAVQYLNALRPISQKANLLDKEPVVDKLKRSQYHRALEIAEEPLNIIKDVKTGTITSGDIKHLVHLYPGLYQNLQNKITSELVDMKEPGDQIPYRMRMGLSLFLGKALDSTMTPQAILAAQPKSPQQQPGDQPQKVTQANAKALDKMSKTFMTDDQARAMGRHQS